MNNLVRDEKLMLEYKSDEISEYTTLHLANVLTHRKNNHSHIIIWEPSILPHPYEQLLEHIPFPDLRQCTIEAFQRLGGALL